MSDDIKNFKILFVSLGNKFWSKVQISLHVLKSYILHKNNKMQINMKTFDVDELSYAEIAGQIADINPSVVCFSMHIFTNDQVMGIAKIVKELNEDIIIIVGGGVPSFEGKKLLENYQFFDICVIGLGEEVLLAILEHLKEGNYDLSDINNIMYKKKDTIVSTPIDYHYRISKADYPFLTDDLQDEEFFFFETSRGCRFGCKYCAYNMFSEKKNAIEFYKWDKIERDIRVLFALPKLKRIAFADSSIFADKERGLKLLALVNELNADKLKNKKTLIDITLNFNLMLMDIDMLKALNRTFMGFDGTSVGLQSIDNEVLKNCARPPFDKEKFLENAAILSGNGKIPINTELIFGLPGDTYEKFKKSFEFCLSDLNANAVVCFRLQVIPGSRYWDEKEKYSMNAVSHPPYSLISSPTFSAGELKNAELLSFTFELIYRIFRNIKKIVDEKCYGKKVDCYETIRDMIKEKYSHFFKIDKLIRHDVYDYMYRLTGSERELRRQLLRDMKDTVTNFVNTRMKTA
ncbi:MAG: radical SAM protein [Spirochaetales bacterium]|nr:radical SAM protein [Spirochaetales bacterium]